MNQTSIVYNFIFFLLFIALTFTSIFLPFPTLLILLIYHYQNKSISSSILASLLSLFLSLIIVSSEIGGDLLNYKIIYFAAYDSKSLDIFVLSQRKEPLFTLLTWLLAGLTKGNFQLYLFIIIFVIYKLTFQTLINLSKLLNIQQSRINSLILLVAFFPFILHLNGIILRQNLSVVLLLFGYSRLLIKHSLINWILIFASVFIHFIAFIPLTIILLIELKFKLKTTLKVFGLILALVFILPKIQSITFIDYLILRLYRSNDFYLNVDSSNVRNMIMPNLIFITTFFIALVNFIKQNKLLVKNYKFSKMYLIYALVYVITFIWVPMNVLEYRILLICYFLFPLIVAEYLYTKIKLLDYYHLILPFQIIIFFVYISIRDKPNNYKDILFLITSPFY